MKEGEKKNRKGEKSRGGRQPKARNRTRCPDEKHINKNNGKKKGYEENAREKFRPVPPNVNSPSKVKRRRGETCGKKEGSRERRLPPLKSVPLYREKGERGESLGQVKGKKRALGKKGPERLLTDHRRS